MDLCGLMWIDVDLCESQSLEVPLLYVVALFSHVNFWYPFPTCFVFGYMSVDQNFQGLA